MEYLALADKFLLLTAAPDIHELKVAGKLVGLVLRGKMEDGSQRGT